MFGWLGTDGHGVDIQELRKEYPEMQISVGGCKRAVGGGNIELFLWDMEFRVLGLVVSGSFASAFYLQRMLI